MALWLAATEQHWREEAARGMPNSKTGREQRSGHSQGTAGARIGLRQTNQTKKPHFVAAEVSVASETQKMAEAALSAVIERTPGLESVFVSSVDGITLFKGANMLLVVI